jgi:hypothetical protein
MQILRPFSDPHNLISLSADLIVRDHENLDLVFKWEDPKNNIIFAHEPHDGRFSGLWQQTCFEAFIQPYGHKNYYEFNFTLQKAWNVFSFEDYRSPQPPAEVPEATLTSLTAENSAVAASFHLPGAKLGRVNISLCAVIVLKDLGVTYWSVKHADSKPNFHHFESFITERTRK